MNIFKKLKAFFVVPTAPEVITERFVEQPKDYPDGLPKNHTEHIDKIGIQPGSKV